MDPARILRRARLSRLRVLHCTNDMPRSFLTIRSTCRVLIAWRSATTVSGTIRLTRSSMIALTERWCGSGMGKSSTAKVLSSASSASLSGLRSASQLGDEARMSRAVWRMVVDRRVEPVRSLWAQVSCSSAPVLDLRMRLAMVPRRTDPRPEWSQPTRGEVEVPEDPTRVVVLNYALAGYLYDLEVPVVATTPQVTESDGEFSPFWSEEAEAQKTEFLPWSNDRFDLEAIIAADPDLIIAGGIGFPLKHATDAHDRLLELAPTVLVSGDKQTWQDQVSFIACEVPGREADFEKFESAYEDRVAEVKDTISIPEGEISILTLDSKDTPYILIEGKSLSAELEPLGFTTPPLFEENDIEPYTAGGDMFGPSLEVLLDVLRSETVFVVGIQQCEHRRRRPQGRNAVRSRPCLRNRPGARPPVLVDARRLR